MYDSVETTPAEHILNMGSDGEVFGLMSELSRTRKLGAFAQKLNAAVLDGAKD